MSCAPVSVEDAMVLTASTAGADAGVGREIFDTLAGTPVRRPRSQDFGTRLCARIDGGDLVAAKQAIGWSGRGRTTKCMVSRIVRGGCPARR